MDGAPRVQNYYAPQIFMKMGLTQDNAALFATGVYGVVKMLSSICFLLFAADSLGRRKSLLVSSVGMTVALYMVGLYEKVYPEAHTGSVSCCWNTLCVLLKTDQDDLSRSHHWVTSRSSACTFTCCK